MQWIITLLLVVIAAIMVFIMTKNGGLDACSDDSSGQKGKSIGKLSYYPYEKKMLLTKTEYAFYAVLKRKCDENNLLICPKVRMEDFLNVTDHKNIMKFRGYIKSRHIDFMICDDKLRLLAGLELDDSSHQRKDASIVDEFKNKVFETIKMPLFRVSTSQASYESQLDNVMNKINKIKMDNKLNVPQRRH